MMAATPDDSFENIELATQELLEAPSPDQRPLMLDSIAKSLTRRLMEEHPDIGVQEVSYLVNQFLRRFASAWRRGKAASGRLN
jgi:hypothetical protein